MMFIYGCRKTVINMALFSAILEIKQKLPVLQRKYGITVMWEQKRRQRCMNRGFV